MSDYKHGSMDITEQEKTYEGFIRASVKVVIASMIVLILLAVFAT